MPPFLPHLEQPNRPVPLNAFLRVLWEIVFVLGQRTRPNGAVPAIALPLAALINARLERLQRRFFSLVGRALAGTLTPVRPRASRARPADAPTRAREKSPLPRAAGWLAKLCPDDAVQRQRNIGHALVAMKWMLDDATVRQLLASDSRFGRTLRPVWRMLWTQPPPECLRLPPRPRKPRKPREKPDIGLAIPRGITRRDLARSRAMAEPTPPPLPPPQPAQPPPGTMTDWTPTHLTLAGRAAVTDPIPNGWRGRDPDRWRRRFGWGEGT